MTPQRTITLWLFAAGSIISSSAYAQVQTPAPLSKPGATAPAPAKSVTVPVPAQKPTASQPPTRLQLEQLAQLQARALAVFEIPGVVFTDVIERTGRFEIGVVNAGVGSRARARLIELGIPTNIIDVVITRPIIPLQAPPATLPKPPVQVQQPLPTPHMQLPPQSLRDQIRPLRGGLQISSPVNGCTLGFIAVRAGVRGFVTNSHCTTTQGGTEGTTFGQPFSPPTSPTSVIGTEEADPAYPSCRSGKKQCRFSDSAWVRLADGVTADLGGIVRTASPNTGSLTVTGIFRIVADVNAIAAVGDVANKVGRTTGWTQGPVTRTGVDTNFTGTNIVLRGQVFVFANSDHGDSGSPVFLLPGGDLSAFLLGILWGHDGAGTFIYSPLANVQRSDELGPLSYGP
ncbi:MAG: hypothetical protein Q7T05_04600 [Dehalococcoidia bacterium]|nr:hypothetical protein [Dehalococcoidia bacterium]